VAKHLKSTKRLTQAGAKAIMAAAEKKAKDNKWNVSIAIVDAGGSLVHLTRIDGAGAATALTAYGKARTAARFGRPTKVLEDIITGGRSALLTIPEIVPLEGGLPITAGNAIVGGIGVSGVASGDDARIAQAGVDALKG